MQKAKRAYSFTNRIRDAVPLLLAGALGGAVALLRFGTEVISPENISWFRGDSVSHFLAWNFFRSEPWHLPPGRIENLLAPLGTSIGGSDALPLLAFPLKLFSASLPPDFQYLGLWLLVNYILQGVFGYLLARTFCPHRWLALFAGLFFLFSPIMIFRAGHIALSSHWLILFALLHLFRSGGFKSGRAQLERRSYAVTWMVIVGLVGFTHPYLAAMVVPVALLSVLLEHRREQLTDGYAATLSVGLLLLLGLEWWVSGLFGLGKGGGFDFYTMNPNALFNPLEHSRFLPALPTAPGQYEGFAYLGFGILLLSAAPLLFVVRHPRQTLRYLGATLRRGLWPLLLLCVGFSLFALGNTVVFILEVVALFLLLLVFFIRNPPALTRRLSALPFPRSHLPVFLFCLGLVMFAAIPLVTGSFRAPGRFIWPVYYLVYLALMVFLFRHFSPRVVAALLLTGLAFQIADLEINRPFRPNPALFARLDTERWAVVVRPFSTLTVIPPFEPSVGRKDDYIDLAFLASDHGKKVTTGGLVRIPDTLERVAREITDEALSGPRDPDTLYIFGAAGFADTYEAELEPGLHCTTLDAYMVCSSQRAPLVTPKKE